MSTFFEQSLFGSVNVPDLSAVEVTPEIKQYQTQSDESTNASGTTINYEPATAEYSLDSIPYSERVQGQNVPQSVNPYTPDGSRLATSQAAYEADQAILAGQISDAHAAKDVLAAKVAARRAAEVHYEQLWNAAYGAQLALNAANAFGSAALKAEKTTAAQMAYDAAHDYSHGGLATAETDVEVAQEDYDAKLALASRTVNRTDLVFSQLLYDLSVADNPTDPLPSSGPPPRIDQYSTDNSFPGFENIPLMLVAGHVETSQTTSSSSSAASYDTSGRYRLPFFLTDGQYQAFAAIIPPPNILLEWSEMTYAYEAVTHTNVDTGNSSTGPDYTKEPTVTRVDKSQTFGLSDCVQVPTNESGSGNWRFLTDENTILTPGSGAAIYIAIGGAPEKNVTTVTIQRAGAKRLRQGWPEYTTDAGAVSARRYKTLTASAAPSAPPGNGYGGSMILQDNSAAGPDDVVIYPGNFDPASAPLSILDQITPASANAAARQALPDSLIPVTQNASLTSKTIRVLSNPPGLKVTLTDEETPDSIHAIVTGAAISPSDTSAHLNEFPGALLDAPDNGDYAAAQVMRYKVAYQSSSQRNLPGTVWTDSFRIIQRTHDLEAGGGSDVPMDLTATFAGSSETEDAAWTAVNLPSNRRLVEIMGTTCDSTDGRGVGTFRLSVVA